jgi:hypothetical protein
VKRAAAYRDSPSAGSASSRSCCMVLASWRWRCAIWACRVASHGSGAVNSRTASRRVPADAIGFVAHAARQSGADLNYQWHSLWFSTFYEPRSAAEVDVKCEHQLRQVYVIDDGPPLTLALPVTDRRTWFMTSWLLCGHFFCVNDA